MRRTAACLLVLGLALTGCGDGGSANPPAATPGTVQTPPITAGDGGYDYVSDVSAHRLVVADICAVNTLLDADPIDFAAIETLYRDGKSSVNADGSIRSIGGFAARDDRNADLQAYYGTPTPLDAQVTAALEGAGAFSGEPDAVRRQGAQKGIQNQVMVAWTLHELDAALAKADKGEFEPAEGAPHNWDEAWAFYRGSEPDCAPYATADKRAGDFSTVGADGTTARANEAILRALINGRDALVAGRADDARKAATEVRRNIVITYSQATLKYAETMSDALAAGDGEKARAQQAEGWSFWRTIEATMAANGADAAVVTSVLSLENPPGEGRLDAVRSALGPALTALAITDADLGTFAP